MIKERRCPKTINSISERWTPVSVSRHVMVYHVQLAKGHLALQYRGVHPMLIGIGKYEAKAVVITISKQ